ncbi:hypothetical protein FACS189430_06360 [Bacteroidia bacterium]|nr:hypothetical protein FACS189430_06360 [Bacteroidia bacterium]
MARPIADTPVLRGQDAVRFMERMENVQPISQEERASMKADYEWFKSALNRDLSLSGQKN